MRDRMGSSPVAALLVVFAMVLTGFAVFSSMRTDTPSAQAGGEASSSGESVQVEAVPGATGATSTASAPQPSRAPESSAEPKFGNTPAPNPTATYDGQGYPDPSSLDGWGFTPTSERTRQEGDAERAQELLGAIVPLWAVNDTRQVNSFESWSAPWSGKQGVAAPFRTASMEAFQDMWGGLSRMGASVEGAKIVSQKELWNLGSHSLWRVEVERRVVPNDGQVGVESSETVAWDFLVNQNNDSFEIVQFVETSKKNENPDTFFVSGDVE